MTYGIRGQTGLRSVDNRIEPNFVSGKSLVLSSVETVTQTPHISVRKTGILEKVLGRYPKR